MHSLKTWAGAALIAAGAAACNNVEFKKSKSGMAYKIFSSDAKGDTAKLAAGKFVRAQVTQKVKDSVLYTTYNSFPAYFPVQDVPASGNYDPSDVFTQLKQGDSLYAVQMMDTFIKKNPQITQTTPYRNGDKIITTVKIEKVFPDQASWMADQEAMKAAMVKKEESAVQAFMSKAGVQGQRTPSGAYVQILQPGTGAKVTPGKYVSVMYKGQTFGGKVFDTNMDNSFNHTEPMGFVLGQQPMIKGFEEGLQMLNVGSKAKIYIPSSLGYGAQPNSPDIKPFEHLIFDIQVVAQLDKAPAPKQMPMPQGMPQGQAMPDSAAPRQ